jgi:hypothetical protein
MKDDTIFLSIAGMDPGWIVGKIANDIEGYFVKKGVTCRVGAPNDYKNEDICYHLGYSYAVPQKKARINSVFITHIDDKLKEKMVVSMRNTFDSFICMSKEDEDFLIQLGFGENKVFGLTLPIRNDYIRPISLGIFSGYYKDGRKNDKWLLDFIREEKDIHLVNLVFIGPRWSEILATLSGYNCTFEWHSTSRKTPFEYKFQQEKLSKLDYYFYMGFDGGAMGSYDAYANGVPLFISDNGYHKEIPTIEKPFQTFDEFNNIFSKIILEQKKKIIFFKENSIDNYCNNLNLIWAGEYVSVKSKSEDKTLVKKRRGYYLSISIKRTLSRIKSFVYRRLL